MERLTCSEADCPIRTEPDEVVLTRERMLRTPPDILFTTTEMLNQRMADSRFGRLFGVGTGADRKPELVLLDEVHTYGGIPGAQTALLLRRWLHASRAVPHFVGLSATLRDARPFFATLVGLPVGAVHEEAPWAGELIEKGMEYLLALRGDAVFWDPPRPLLTAVLLTLARRLRRQWRTAAPNGALPGLEFFEPNAPLPEFVPRVLFQELNLPEVTVVTDPQQQRDEERRDPLPVARALAEFAPGRVSRRYGIMHRYARHWVAPPALDGLPEQDLPVGRFFPMLDEVGTCAYADDGATRAVRCVRPWVLKPTVPPQRILDSSNAFPDWHTQILPDGEGVPADVPRTTP